MFRTFDKRMRMAAVVVCCLALAVLTTQEAHAQGFSYNPYLIQGIVDETGSSVGSTLVPAEFGGTGYIRFDVGNTGSDSLMIPPPGDDANDVVRLVITLSRGAPDYADPLAALSGPGVDWFDWMYDAGDATYYATQKETIPGQSRQNITIAYRVTENSFLAQSPTVSNGFSVNLQAPGYTAPQTTDDDAVSSYTYVEAVDYGDAPASYGTAEHTINVAGNLNAQYVYLGSTVDPEAESQDSAAADGDDNNQTNGLNPTDDEDGVLLPVALQPGETVIVPIVTTIEGTGFGALNGWIDWNGNGVFDAAEQIIANRPVVTPGASTQNIAVDVPADAALGKTFARFRFGNPAGPTGTSSYGEVEDYRVTIGDNVELYLPFISTGPVKE